MPEQLEIAAHGITAILATWLGLTVTLRAGRLPAARAFGLIALFLVTWSVALGERYEQRGDRPAAAACYRQARVENGQALPPADAALSRLGVATS